MAEELQTIDIHDDFYRDGFGKVSIIIIGSLIAIAFLIAASLYLHLNKPQPTTFPVYPDWRIQPDVPLNQPYLSEPDMLQWVSDALRQVFVYDFYHYNDQLKKNTTYFTANGWRVFLGQLNSYVNYNTVQTNKWFVNASPAGAPFILQQGLLSGRYAWWVQMPVALYYTSYNRASHRTLTLQILVTRVPTLNNLTGVGIDNVIVTNGAMGATNGTAQSPTGNQ